MAETGYQSAIGAITLVVNQRGVGLREATIIRNALAEIQLEHERLKEENARLTLSEDGWKSYAELKRQRAEVGEAALVKAQEENEQRVDLSRVPGAEEYDDADGLLKAFITENEKQRTRAEAAEATLTQLRANYERLERIAKTAGESADRANAQTIATKRALTQLQERVGQVKDDIATMARVAGQASLEELDTARAVADARFADFCTRWADHLREALKGADHA